MGRETPPEGQIGLAPISPAMERKQTPLINANARVKRSPVGSALRSRFRRTSNHQALNAPTV